MLFAVMVRPDVIDLGQFYESPLGQVARRLIRRRIREIWPNGAGLRVLGMGYAIPYLRPFRDRAERVIAVMPAAQGVLPWPADEPRLVALAEETDLPLPDNSIDLMLLVHGLESGEQVRAMLREAWRVLAASGRLLAVVPNRRGIWARLDHTPFGHGQPYTPPQLSRLLRDTMFAPASTVGALYLPPSRRRFFLRTAGAWERVGARLWPRFPGVVMIEAGKQVYATAPARERRRRGRRAIIVPRPATPRTGALSLDDQSEPAWPTGA